MVKKVKTDWGGVNEPNSDDSLSEMDIFRLKRATIKLLEKFPKYKDWIYAVQFRRETFYYEKFVFMYIYLNDVDVNYVDVLDIEKNVTDEIEEFDSMLYECEALGSMGYIKDGLCDKENVYLIETLIREQKIDSILR